MSTDVAPAAARTRLAALQTAVDDLGSVSFGATMSGPGRHRGDRALRAAATQRRCDRSYDGQPSYVPRHRASGGTR